MTLTSLADGIWIDSAPVRIVGTHLTATMTVMRLPGSGLLVWSPLALTAERQAAVEALGKVTHLYAPNLFHHLWLGEWSAAFPAACVHAPEGLSKKRPELRIDRLHGASASSDFSGALDELRIDGFRLAESVLVHRPTRTLVVADLVHNVGRPEGAWSRFYTQAMGFYDCVALSRALRWMAFSDRAAARRSIDESLKLPFERLIVGHGAPLPSGGKAAVRAAFSWLGVP